MSDETLPPGWAMTELGDICAIHDSRRIPINASERNERIAGKTDAELYPYYGATGEVGKIDGFLFDGEYVLIGEDGAPFLEPHRGVSYLVNGKFWVNNHAHILEHPTSNRFLCHYLRQIDYRPYVTGTTRLKLNQAQMRKITIPLPPLPEQKRIVAKIEELFSELEAGEASLRKARRQLGVYRQSLLKQAFEGKLTQTWRTQNPAKLESPAVAEVECPGNLPAGWRNTKLGNVIEEPAYGTSKKCSYESSGLGVLRIPNVVNGAIDATDLKFAEFTDDERKSYELRDGDLLLIRSNGSVSIVGRCAMVEPKHTEFLYAGYLIRLRPRTALIDPRFLRDQMSSHRLRSQIEFAAKSTSGVNNINSKEIQRLVISLPSLPEQQEIVRLLDSAVEAIERNERELDAALQRSEALRQSILKKAFTGRLVPQDPTDEPASTLLARMRAEQGAKVASPRRGRKPASSAV